MYHIEVRRDTFHVLSMMVCIFYICVLSYISIRDVLSFSQGPSLAACRKLENPVGTRRGRTTVPLGFCFSRGGQVSQHFLRTDFADQVS